MIYITRKEHFSAAHKLFNPNWSQEKNIEVFGKCAYENFHGHNYQLHVTVKGVPDSETGYVVDLKELSRIIQREVLEKIDHRNINLDVEFMKGIMASTENLVIGIWKQLEPHVKGGTLHKIELFETERNSVEYYGE
ncbi:MAG: 6-pyruvoyltetrahydropterin/6-carboxytetrahydropterin synthase [Sphingobacteriales bacterium]|jgi:6-pyruvoyltetrahydropterin/6-carboxytetrahydropterin synthase